MAVLSKQHSPSHAVQHTAIPSPPSTVPHNLAMQEMFSLSERDGDIAEGEQAVLCPVWQIKIRSQGHIC